MPAEPLNIAIIGLGTVGTGVARVLLDEPELAVRVGAVVLRVVVERGAHAGAERVPEAMPARRNQVEGDRGMLGDEQVVRGVAAALAEFLKA